MLAILKKRVLLVDLDPQSNLTAMCISEQELEQIWPDAATHPRSVMGSIQPIIKGTGDIHPAIVYELEDRLSVIPGDLGLSTFEARLSDAWPRALDRDEAAFRTLSAFYRIIEHAAKQKEADIILMDVGPNLGAINRAALLSADFIVTPLSPDLFSMQGLRNLGPTLIDWRNGWKDRIDRNIGELSLPSGSMKSIGYIVMQTGMRLSRPVQAYERWIQRMPAEYHSYVLRDKQRPTKTELDSFCLGVMRHYQSLMPLAQDAQKPMFALRPADGAIGSHMQAVQRCYEDFKGLAKVLMERILENN
jgi:cellulose biosynthesis protein BcsQ